MFFSSSWALLPLVAECFLAYLHPLQWQHTFVTVLEFEPVLTGTHVRRHSLCTDGQFASELGVQARLADEGLQYWICAGAFLCGCACRDCLVHGTYTVTA